MPRLRPVLSRPPGPRAAALALALAVAPGCGPDVTTVERSATYAATVDDVYPHLVDLKKFYDWSPWSKMDPDAEVTFSASTDTVGATYAWKGNDDVGAGQMTITEAVAGERVVHKLEFFAPWEGVSESSLHLRPAGEGVEVTWKYRQDNDMMGKLMTHFIDMDEMLGGDYERGLANLAEKVDASVKARTAKEAEAKAAAAKAEAEAQAAEDGAADGAH